jgi:glycosyltransferase involved in cell wall biosynthesis
VLCANVTSLPEIAGGAALLFDPHDPDAIAGAIARMAGDSRLRRDLVTRGTAVAESFGDPREMARRYWKILCEAAQNRGSGSDGAGRANATL